MIVLPCGWRMQFESNVEGENRVRRWMSKKEWEDEKNLPQSLRKLITA
jgi:hypothetical protein